MVKRLHIAIKKKSENLEIGLRSFFLSVVKVVRQLCDSDEIVDRNSREKVKFRYNCSLFNQFLIDSPLFIRHKTDDQMILADSPIHLFVKLFATILIKLWNFHSFSHMKMKTIAQPD